MERPVSTRIGDGLLIEMAPAEIYDTGDLDTGSATEAEIRVAGVLVVPIESVARFEECAGLRTRA